MKEIRAVIRPQKLERLRAALRAVPGFPGMTVTRAEGCGATSSRVAHNIREQLTDYTVKMRVEIVCPDEVADALVEAIIHTANTGQTGDGLVWVVPIERAVFLHKTTVGSPEG